MLAHANKSPSPHFILYYCAGPIILTSVNRFLKSDHLSLFENFTYRSVCSMVSKTQSRVPQGGAHPSDMPSEYTIEQFEAEGIFWILMARAFI